MKLVILFICILSVAGCGATFQAKDCGTTDWQQLGYQDALRGKTRETFETYQQVCAQQATQPNLNEYVAGFKKGVADFCTRENGYNQGLKGGKYSMSCAKDTAYFEGFEAGSKKYVEERERREVEALTRRRGDVTDSMGVPGGAPGM